MLFEVRKNTECVMVIDADDEQEALKIAENAHDDEWDQSHSPITAEQVEDCPCGSHKKYNNCCGEQ